MNLLSFAPLLTLGFPASLLAGITVIAGCASAPDPNQTSRASGSVAVAPDTASAAHPAPVPTPAKLVTIRIDETIAHQVVEGFGASVNEYFDMVSREDLMGKLRPRVIEAVYGQVGLTMGALEINPYENFDPSRNTTANDDGDPFTFNWSAFNFVRSEGQKIGIVDLARPYGFDNFTLHCGTNVRWANPWMADLRKTNYRLYLDEMAENVVAPLVYWRDKFGIVPRWHQLFNEPTTGNSELGGGSVQEVVDLV